MTDAKATPQEILLDQLESLADHGAATMELAQEIASDALLEIKRLRSTAPQAGVRDVLEERQRIVIQWGERCFGAEHMRDKIVRAARFFEEAAELVQAIGLPRDHAMRAFNHVYSREAGEPAQEVGAVANTLMALCGAAGLSFDDCQQAEIERCLARDPSHFAKRNEQKLRDVDALSTPAERLTGERGTKANPSADVDPDLIMSRLTGEAVAWQMRIFAGDGWINWAACSVEQHERIQRSGQVGAYQAESRELGVIVAPALTAGTGDDDLRRLVIAARVVAFQDHGPEARRELDEASEAFASIIPWEDEPAFFALTAGTEREVANTDFISDDWWSEHEPRNILLVKALAAFDAFSKALSVPNGPSLAVQQHDPSWEAWKVLCDVMAALSTAPAASGADKQHRSPQEE